MNNPRLNAFFNILWFVIAAVMMAWKRQISQRQKIKTTSKVKLKATSQPTVQPTTIDDELARLKAQIAEEKKKNP